ncbi:hypothetical protein DFH06DRAFT_1034242 [Mycena polygramma]|nr:hypothetical protein DFH06DRAFT_1034242 [Mycena polygramma]
MDIAVNDPLLPVKVTSATCSFFALGATIYRLYQRRGRYWVDDFWVMFAFGALIIQVVAVFLHVPLPNNLSITTRIVAYYLTGTTFYAIIWASRLSILFSVIRIDPSAERRKRLSWVAVAFVVTALFLLAQLLWACEPNHSWIHSAHPQCELPLQVAVAQLVADLISDSILLFAPWPLFRSLGSKSLRRKLTLIFSTCVGTTILSFVHAVFILRDNDAMISISGLVEDCISLTIANIPVIITTTIDIVPVGDGGDLERSSRSAQFTSVFRWGSDASLAAESYSTTETSSFEATGKAIAVPVVTPPAPIYVSYRVPM